MLPPLCLHCHGACHKSTSSVVISGGLSTLASVYFFQNGLPSHIVSISCHMLGILLAYVRYEFPQCLQFMRVSPQLDFLCEMYCYFFMPFHGIELFIVFCGFHECFLCSLQMHLSGPG